MSKSRTSKARWAAMRGDHATAGDIYRLAGELERALKSYLKGKHHRSAAEVASELGQPNLASREFERAAMPRQAAEQARKAGEPERAARLFVLAGLPRQAAEIHEQRRNPSDAAALYEHAGDFRRAAMLFLDARQPAGAARTIRSLKKSEIESVTPAELRELSARCGRQLLAAGNPDKAASWLHDAGLASEAATAWERAGDLKRAVEGYLAANELERAADLVESVEPGSIESDVAANALRAAGRWAAAASLYLEAGMHAEAAVCLEEIGCDTEAAYAHEAAGELKEAGQSLERAGHFGDAAKMFQRAGLLREAAACLVASGELSDAARTYEDCEDFNSAAALYEQLGDVDAGLKALQSLPSEQRVQPEIARRLATLFERKGLDSMAADEYRRALASEPRGTQALELWYAFASVLERCGRLREAAQAYRRVLSIDYSFADAKKRLAALEARTVAYTTTTRGAFPDRYRLTERIESALAGDFFIGLDTVMERKVVVRRLGAKIVPSEQAAERILSDLRRVARLHHPTIGAIFDVGRDENGIFVIQEHVSGRSLRDVLQEKGKLTVPQTVQVLTRVAESLDYAHGLGLLARSLRPESIMLTPGGEAKLVEFGISLRSTDSGSAPATYRAPEVQRGERMDPASDLFLLGVLAWEMLIGQPPNLDPESTTTPQLPLEDPHEVPELLRRIISECLLPDRTRRLGSAQKLLEELHGTHLLPGAMIANRYEIVRELGRGGMGTVFSSRDLVLEEPVALKVLGGTFDETLEKRFIQEIRLARQINHPNVVRVHTFDRWRDLRFIVMEFIDGIDLRAWTEARRPIPIGQAIDLVIGIARGLSAAHSLGIVHRDVKPENVLVDTRGVPKLVDFGIARQGGDMNLTREGLVIGSPAYMAPEQISGADSDHRADLYSLGVLTYFLLAGREPFCSDNVAEVLRMQLEDAPPRLTRLRPGVPSAIEQLVLRLLQKNADLRPSTAENLIEELETLKMQLTVSAT